MDDSSSALEQFRRQWQEEVKARSRQNKGSWKKEAANPTGTASPGRPKPPVPAKRPPIAHSAADHRQNEDLSEDDTADPEMEQRLEQIDLSGTAIDDDEFTRTALLEPRSALEHFEKAVENEAQGKLGDSLSHYRKAYRLDSRVDKTYKDKHFPASSKPANINRSNPPARIPSTAHHSSKEPRSLEVTFSQLIESYAGLQIPRAEPVIAGDSPPACPMAMLPAEVLFEILLWCAIQDPASFTRLSLVCRRLAYHVDTEKSIWKRIALGREFGFKSQLYDFACDVVGGELIYKTLEELGQPTPVNPMSKISDPDWKEIFHTHPRIRFSGVYISTVNYTRAGAASATQATWNTPVHIVTYYRYLRFFRNGSVISLLSLHEPIDVVHNLTPENLATARKENKGPTPVTTNPDPVPVNQTAGANSHIVQNIMKYALRGRWRLCHPLFSDEQSTKDIATGGAGVEGDLHIETEGPGPRYMYTMHLSLKSSTRSRTGVKNNKLAWKGFWSYNHLTSDWGEFSLKNDKPFLFSRVKSYGFGY